MSVPAETLGAFPHPAEATPATLAAPESLAAEQFRLLLARVDRAASARPLRTLAVTSCGRGEGRSTTSLNLAYAAARDGREVVLVECDLRRPKLAALLDLAPRPGLAEVVEGKAELAQALTRVNGLSVICAGEARDPGSVLRSPRLGATLDALRSSFPLVVFDAPPALAFADASRLAAACDGVLLVVRAGATPREVVRMAVDSLAEKVVGIVLNGVEDAGYARYLRNDAIAT
ncbi:MAG: CpsD/CapB family tyrosine-protein kinase [Anaeromyxobacteraceae bacterium]